MATLTLPEVGKRAPDFSIADQNQEMVQLSDFKGKWVVLYFYPKDNTPGCTVEARDFTAQLAQFKALDAVVLGVSPDSCESHQGFIKKEGLKIKLLSDPQHKVLETYGAWGKKQNYGKEYMGVIRSTFVIDPEGKLAYAWTNVKAAGHAEKVREKLAELQEI